MSTLDRRQLLALSGAAAVAGALPFASVTTPAAAPMPTWIVGTPGEWDHEIIRAATEELALRFRCEECEFANDPEADPLEFEGGEDCLCEACISSRGYEATRVPQWDGRTKADIGSGDWIDLGNEAMCDRCHCETSRETDGRNVGGKAICDDCLTLADWDIVDPERAAELRAEAEDDSPPPGSSVGREE